MTLSEAIRICQGTVGNLPYLADNSHIAPDDWLSAARYILPRLRALQTTLDETSDIGIHFPEREVTPFMERCLREIQKVGQVGDED